MEAMRIAKQSNTMVLLNPAPGRIRSAFSDIFAAEDLPDEVFKLCDIICPNEVELETLTGKPVKNPQDAIEAAQVLLGQGVSKVLVTLGSQGCVLVVKGEEPFHVPAVSDIQAVDTTGAGDCFIGR